MGQPQGSTAANKQQTQVKTRRKTKLKLKPSVIAIYVSTFVLIVAVIFIGYRQPQNTTVVVNASNLDSTSQANQTSVDSVVATNVAANVATAANLPIATSVANLAVSTQTQSELVVASGVSDTKPQLIGFGSISRTVTSYTVKAGDNVDTIAAQFHISKDTVKWANNLTTDRPAVGSVLRILPVDGVLYTVKSSDTIDSIASRYGVDKTRLVLYNDLDVSGLQPGAAIVLPSATLPGNERPGYVAPVAVATGTGFGGATWHISNGTSPCPGYGYGYCTCYAYARRVQLGLPVGSNWGNASSWAWYAASAGYLVNHTPSVGAILQNGGGLGHVGIVESVLPNGDISISEMNAYVNGGGWNRVSGRIVPAGNVGQYNYIH
ncbi:LysM peptidoglycan-binding domain-containing protein [Candidatus Saccharibacteria bacterium]|nr:LysM peptidoglycan-binding domain-containing protein [Candidatus Saccharibacteria bacterium]